jgi:hypothetical protein
MKFTLVIVSCILSLSSIAIDRADADENPKADRRYFGDGECASRWVRQLSASDPAQADQAVIKIIALGPIATDELIRDCDSEQTFRGLCMSAEIDATSPRQLTVGYVVLYLIRSILTETNPGRHRFLSPLDTPTQQAAKIYKEWYEDVLNHREDMREIDKYLKRHGLGWG